MALEKSFDVPGKQPALPSVLWSKGIAQWADYSGNEEYWQLDTESHKSASFFRRYYEGMHGIVWIRLGSAGSVSDVDIFAHVLEKLTKPIVLLTTDGDCSVPSNLNPDSVAKIEEHPLVLQWFTQNYDGSVTQKIQSFPIGLDLHTVRDNDLNSPDMLLDTLENIRQSSKPISERHSKLACDLHLSLDHPERFFLGKLFWDSELVDFLPHRISQREVWEYYSKFAMVFSTHGNGLDCHRTWELLKLGCIVVTKTSSLDSLYDGLPVVIVDDWRECNDKKFIAHNLEEMRPLTAAQNISTRLSSKFWIDKLRCFLEPPKL